jgi:hypothetical protein
MVVDPWCVGVATCWSRALRQTRQGSSAVAAAAGRLDGRTARSRLFLFLVICVNASGQREKNEQTNNLFHIDSPNPVSATKRTCKSKKILQRDRGAT